MPGCASLARAVTTAGQGKPHDHWYCKFFDGDKRYGFITSENGAGEAFVHISATDRAGMTVLSKDQRVSYEYETDRRGKTSAVNLQDT